MTHQPRKRFGQHFLSDQTIVARIVAALRPEQKQHLVEIGPGQGALTVPVIRQCVNMEAVELDRDLIPEIESRIPRNCHLQIHQADALDFDFAKLKQDERLLRVFGNLPYNISTPLIFHLFEFAPIISDMLFMLQKEVAERMAAAPSSKAYGRLSVMTQYHCQVELLFQVPKEAFYPPPQVESFIIQLLPHRKYPLLAKNYHVFESLVKTAFMQRRKTLRNSLRQMVSDEIWSQVNIAKESRAENLSVADYVLLSNALS